MKSRLKQFSGACRAVMLLALVVLGVSFNSGGPGVSPADAAVAAPVLTAVTPADQATGVAITTPVTATFNQEMKSSSLTSGNFTVTKQSKIVKVAAGQYETLGLRDDGTVTMWGQYYGTQYNIPKGLTNVVSIAANYVTFGAVKSDGTIAVWGVDHSGMNSAPQGMNGVSALAIGQNHVAALKTDGTVVTWGINATPAPAGLSGVVAIAAGAGFTVALKSDKTVVAWGVTGAAVTSAPSGLSGVVAVSAVYDHAVALKDDGTVVAWGATWFGQSTVPAGVSNVVAIAAGIYHTVALKADGSVIAWGKVYSYSASNYIDATVPAGLPPVTAVTTNYLHTVALKGDGTVVAWGEPAQTSMPVAWPKGHIAISSGDDYSTGIRFDGSVTAWGDDLSSNTNSFGETTVPAGLSGVTALSTRKFHSLALKADGTVVAWGNNSNGQSTVPAGLSGVVAVAAGGGSWYQGHSVALKADGTVVSWGSSNSYLNVPAGLSSVTAIAAGDMHTAVLKADGTVTAWGYDWFGETEVPAGLTGVVSIVAGDGYTAALKNDGTVAAWGSINGYNSYAQYQATVPAGLSGVVALTGGYSFIAALKADGSVVVWADNFVYDVPADFNNVVAISGGGTRLVGLKADGTTIAWNVGHSVLMTSPSSPYETIIDGAVTWDSATLRATFTPALPLPLGSQFQVSISGIAQAVAGGRLGSDSVWSFTTGATYAIGTNITGNGSIDCTPAAPQPGATVTCAITPAVGYQFTGFTDNGADVFAAASSGNYLIPAIAGDHNLAATFTAYSLPLTVTFSGAGSVEGTSNGTPAAFTLTTSGSTAIAGGAVVTLTPTPKAVSNSGTVFTGWLGDCSGMGDSNNACQVTMSAARYVTATFKAAPKITVTSPLTGGTYKVAYSKPLTATGGTLPYSWSVAAGSALPAGLVINATTGAITGTPTVYGSFTFTIQVKDKNGTIGANTFTLDIAAMNITTASPLKSGTVGVAYSAVLAATGGTKPYAWTIASGSLPPGVAFNTLTGTFSGTPTFGGSYPLTLMVEDLTGASTTKAFALDIAVTPLSISTATPVTSGTLGGSFSLTLVAAGGVKPYTWSVSAGKLPTGLGLNTATGVLSGIPASGGNHSFTLQVEDKAGTKVAKSFTQNIVVQPLTITTTPLTSGTLSVAYSKTMTATGGVGPNSWAITSGKLPPGIGLATGTGVLSGTPAKAGSYTFTTTVKDSAGTTAAATYTVAIQ